MDLESTILSKLEKERQILYHLYVESKKNTNESMYKTETNSDIEKIYGSQREKDSETNEGTGFTRERKS